jgi:hypothetical protein
MLHMQRCLSNQQDRFHQQHLFNNTRILAQPKTNCVLPLPVSTSSKLACTPSNTRHRLPCSTAMYATGTTKRACCPKSLRAAALLIHGLFLGSISPWPQLNTNCPSRLLLQQQQQQQLLLLLPFVATSRVHCNLGSTLPQRQPGRTSPLHCLEGAAAAHNSNNRRHDGESSGCVHLSVRALHTCAGWQDGLPIGSLCVLCRAASGSPCRRLLSN